MVDETLTPQQKLELQRYTLSYLVQVTALFGILNVAAIATALYFFVGTAAKDSVQEELKKLKLNETISSALLKIGKDQGVFETNMKTAQIEMETASGALKENMDAALQSVRIVVENTEKLNADATKLKNDVEEVQRITEDGSISNLAEIARAFRDDKEISQRLDKMSIRLENQEGEPLSVLSGQSCAKNNPWFECINDCGSLKPISGIVEIKFEQDLFSIPPHVFTSIEGSGSWTTEGVSAIYSKTIDGFRLYAYNQLLGNQPYWKYANSQNHCVSWLAIGQ